MYYKSRCTKRKAKSVWILGTAPSSAFAQVCFKKSLLYKVSISPLLLHRVFDSKLFVYIVLYRSVFSELSFCLTTVTQTITTQGPLDAQSSPDRSDGPSVVHVVFSASGCLQQPLPGSRERIFNLLVEKKPFCDVYRDTENPVTTLTKMWWIPTNQLGVVCFFLILPISTFTCTDSVKYFSRLIFCTNVSKLCMFPYLKVGCRVLDLCIIFFSFFFACGYQIYTLVVFEYNLLFSCF